jgi:TonB family protein
MSNDKLHTIYTAADIEQYFSGKLLPQQMHAIEKAALDDPFLAEAMEGYGAMKNTSWKKELAGAREEIENTKTGAKIVSITPPFKWWKAVAAAVIIAGGAGLAYQLNNAGNKQNKTDNIVIAKKDSTDTINTIAGATDVQKPAAIAQESTGNIVIAEAKNNTQQDSIFAYEPAKRNRVAVLQNDDNNVAVNEPSGYIEKRLPVTAAAPSQHNNAEQTITDKETDQAVTQNYDAMASNRQAAMNRVFIAEVVGADKAPLPFAKINIPAENVGTYTDVNGKFRLVGVDSTLNIEVRAAGFASRTFNIASGVAKNTLVLNEAPFAAKDIVQLKRKATNNNTENRNRMQFDTVLNAEPVDGWSNYNTYLNNNITSPEEVLQKNIHGEVEVSFDVQKDGKISNVNIDKSLCGNCDQEAARAIKEGPQWKVKKGKKEKARVKISF